MKLKCPSQPEHVLDRLNAYLDRTLSRGDDIAVRKALAERNLARGEATAAEKWAQECLYIDVYDPVPDVLLADAQSAEKKFAEAIAEYETAIKLKARKPNDLNVKVAKAQLGLGQRDAAKATLDGILKEDPEHPAAKALRDEIDSTQSKARS